jgi:hypothetical protein
MTEKTVDAMPAAFVQPLNKVSKGEVVWGFVRQDVRGIVNSHSCLILHGPVMIS